MWVLLISVLEFLLGVIAAAEMIEEKKPAWKQKLDKLRQFDEILGFAGLICGLFMLIGCMLSLGKIIALPFNVFTMLATALCLIALGLILGLSLLRKNLKDPEVSFPILPKIEAWRAQILPQKKLLGEIAMISAVLYLLMHMTA